MKPNKILILLTALFLFAFNACKKDCINTSRCELKPDSGPCKAYAPRYYFDQEEGKCMEFIWGGCDGTVPFDTLEECQECECKD